MTLQFIGRRRSVRGFQAGFIGGPEPGLWNYTENEKSFRLWSVWTYGASSDLCNLVPMRPSTELEQGKGSFQRCGLVLPYTLRREVVLSITTGGYGDTGAVPQHGAWSHSLFCFLQVMKDKTQPALKECLPHLCLPDYSIAWTPMQSYLDYKQ